MIKQRWVTAQTDTQLVDSLADALGTEKSIVRILVNRGLTTKEKITEFLNPDISRLSDPFLLKDMDKAASRIKAAVKNKEKIAVYGDYDVDGITGVTVLMLYLMNAGADVFYYIPDRLKDGYGLNMEAMKYIKDKGAQLIVTVDCGITGENEIAWAESNGIDTVVTDHHKCPEKLPKCCAVVNPKRSDSEYPFKDLAGVGVAFKLISALNGKLDCDVMNEIYSLTALGTVADIVPLIDENRIIVSYGIDIIRKGKCKGLNALLEVASIMPENITSTALSFQVAPRINAAGRMGNASEAVKMFVSDDINEINRIALELNEQNIERQNVEKDIFDEALSIINNDKTFKNEEIIVLGREGWHSGVIGIVASKITEEFNKPCIMITFEDGIGKGSLRSVKGFNIYKALESVSSLLIKFGGHELAAGLSLKKENFDEFRKQICEYAKNNLDSKNTTRELMIDSEISEGEMNVEFARKIAMLEPFGMANPQPVFVVKNAKVKDSCDFKEGKHLRLSVIKKNTVLTAVGFSLGKYASSLKKNEEIYIAGTAVINDFRGVQSFQMRIKDIRLA